MEPRHSSNKKQVCGQSYNHNGSSHNVKTEIQFAATYLEPRQVCSHRLRPQTSVQSQTWNPDKFAATYLQSRQVCCHGLRTQTSLQSQIYNPDKFAVTDLEPRQLTVTDLEPRQVCSHRFYNPDKFAVTESRKQVFSHS